ncbi:hypothetical protein MCAG_03023 [Micromonospora sp. ATCC 39149]|nr:hypothetical protein MCAG_03023 [Micromonospora sp. ATCC 39149]
MVAGPNHALLTGLFGAFRGRAGALGDEGSGAAAVRGGAVTGAGWSGWSGVEAAVAARAQRTYTPEMAREITSRWISDVPSKMV